MDALENKTSTQVLAVIGKHGLSSSPLSTPYHAKRFRFYTDSDSMSDISNGRKVTTHRDSDDMNNSETQSHRDSGDHDIPVPSSDSLWPMDYSMTESNALEQSIQYSEDNVGYNLNLDTWAFKQGQEHHLPVPVNGVLDIPTIIHSNLKNGKMYQSAVDIALFGLFRREDKVDDTNGLWEDIYTYTDRLREQCVDKSPDEKEDYPILHRHRKHLAIVNDPLTGKDGVSERVLDTAEKEWERLKSLYGPFDDIQNELRALVDLGYNMLSQFQSSVASYDLTDLFKLANLLTPLQEAINELGVLHYVIRQMLIRRSVLPQFVSATAP